MEGARRICNLRYERRLWAGGITRIAGIDEAGRGPLAGPVVAAAVVLYRRFSLPGLTDSKLLPEKLRTEMFEVIIRDGAVAYGVGSAEPEEIDRVNILQATYLAMQRAVAALTAPPDYLLIDGLPVPVFQAPQTAIVQGDGISLSIAAASVIAKVTRDRMMRDIDSQFPQYRFAEHKGYATPEHLDLLRIHGPCQVHRRSFSPVAQGYLPLD
jgi:ribonuclease HII